MSDLQIERNCCYEAERLKNESIFHCASGKLGVRGCFEEGCPAGSVTIRGAYLNGFCETEPITYNEKLYGFPEEKQTIVNLPDAQGIEFRVKGKKICCWDPEATDFRYILDMGKGIVKRSFLYDTGFGKLSLIFERLSSFERPGLFSIRCRVHSVDYSGELQFQSFLNGKVRNFTNSSDPRIASGSGEILKINDARIADRIFDGECQHLLLMEAETHNSHRKVFTTVSHEVVKKKNDSKEEKLTELQYRSEDRLMTLLGTADLLPGEELILCKYCVYQELTEMTDVEEMVLEAHRAGFDTLLKEQKQCLDVFWKKSRVVVNCDEIRQEYLDFCLYGMYASAGRDGKTSIAAKGVSGEGYEGHYFWDSEIYIFPFFLITVPEIAKSFLLYRYSKLEQAKEHARLLGHEKGALYPWRTISGSECSSYYPSGSAQYHINGDIARAFIQYWNTTADKEFLGKTCEVLVETARLWMDVGHYKDGSFRIDCVTGPDEYTCIVNNNYYTNAGAAENLRNASRLTRILMEMPEYAEWQIKTGVTENELEEFEEAASKMYYPYDETLRIIKQDDTFLEKKPLDLAGIPRENFPLLLHYHPLFLNRHQVCKQADTVLANHLYKTESPLIVKNTFDYYEKITTHDSSLSNCIFGIMAIHSGDLDKGKRYFLKSIGTDLEDHNGNTRDGIHTANMGGSYRMMTAGFAGARIEETGLSLFPMLPEGFRLYSFSMFYMGRRIRVCVDPEGTTLQLQKEYADTTEELEVQVYGERVMIGTEEIRVKRKAKAVILDLDGVITDTVPLHYRAWKGIADEMGVSFDEKKNEHFKGVSRPACLKMLLEWGSKEVTPEQFEEILVRKNNDYKELLKTLGPENILPGVMDCIRKLHERNIPIAVFSVSHNTEKILLKLGLQDEFDCIVAGPDITHSKPHHEGYLLAAERLHIDPRLCVMVEDSAAGITGARKLSMKTLAVMKENLADADLCISSTEELNRIFDLL